MNLKKRNYLSLLALVLILVLGPMVYFGLLKPHKTAAGWFDEGWHYRTAINITNSGAADSNKKVKFDIDTATLYTAGKIKISCDDSRFTDANGKQLQYYLDSGSGACNTNSTDYYVLVPTINAGTTTIYHYYGNPTAVKGSENAQFSQATFTQSATSTKTEEISKAPVAYWSFDEGYGSVLNNFSSTRINGTFVGSGNSAPDWQTENMCLNGKCLKFRGISSGTHGVDVADTSSFQLSNALTVEAWFKTSTGDTSPMAIIRKDTYSGTRYLWGLAFSNKTKFKVQAEYYNGTNFQTESKTTLNDGKWHHAVQTIDGTTMSLYIDGIYQSQVTITGTQGAPTGQLGIGIFPPTSIFPRAYPFDGFLDEVKIYPYARSAAEIKADFNARGTQKGTSARIGSKSVEILSDGLVGYWKMDEASWNGSANEVVDSSGNGNHGQGVGSTIPTTSAGKFGNGGIFNGINNYIEMADTASLSPGGAFTFSTWIYQTAACTGECIIFNKESEYEWRIYNGAIAYAINNTSPGWAWVDTGITISQSTWTHILLTYDSTAQEIKAYKNGELVSTRAGSTGLVTDAGQTLRLAARSGPSSYFGGTLDETRIYNRALSPSEVSDLYNWAPGPYTYLTFDEGSGTAINDKSGNGYSGTWNGSGTHWDTGKFGKAGKFNGSTDYVSFSSLPKPSNLPVTIEFWARPVSSTPVGMFDSAPGIAYVFRNLGAGTVEWWNGSPAVSLGLTAATWTHLAFIYDYSGGNQTITWYKNGIKQTTGSAAGAGTWAWTTFRLGNINGGNDGWYSGLLDDFKIYDYARTQKQIIEDMNAGHPAVGSRTPIGYWKFDEGVGSTAHNSGSAGSVLDGGLSNFTSPPTDSSGWTNNGKYNRALIFDGAIGEFQENVNLGNKSELETLEMTISAWVYRKGDCGDFAECTIMAYGQTGNQGYALAVTSTDGYYKAQFNLNDLQKVYGNTTINVNQWYHVAGSIDGSTIKLYVNGKLDSTNVQSYTPDYSMDKDIIIGTKNTGLNVPMNGIIDEVKFYNFALTEDEIKLDYNRSSSLQLGTISTGTGNTASSTAASQEYCIPGDTAVCSPPIAIWDFNEGVGTSAFDTSGNGNNGGLVGPVWTSGKIGNALSFNGTSNYLYTNTSYTNPQDFTISAWFKTSQASGHKIIGFEDTQNGTSTSYDRHIYIGTDGKVYFGINWPASLIISPNTYTDNKWHYVSATHNSSNEQKLYLDGVLIGSTSSTAQVMNGYWRIGANKLASWTNGSDGFFDGQIDQVRVYNYARSPAQIAWDYNKGAPVAHYKFDECQGSAANNSSSNNYNGIITIGASGTQANLGTCSVGTGSTSAWGNGSTGKYNASLNFDGTDDYVNTGTIPSMSTFSISGWFKTTATSGWGYIVGNHPTQDNGTFLSLNGTNNTGLRFSANLGGEQVADSTANIRDGIWHHAIGTYDGSSLRLYVDGKLQKTTSGVSGTQTGFINYIGSYTGTDHWFNGQIDDVRIYNYALTATQVKTLYNQGSAVRFGD